MRRTLSLLLFCLLAIFHLPSSSFAQGTVTPTWTFQTYGLQPFGTKNIIITPLRPVGNNGNLIAIGDPIRGTTTNSSFTTNLLNGSYYRVEFWSGYNVYGLTNFFDSNTTGAVDGGDLFYRAYGQPADRGGLAPSLPYAMAIFMLKFSGVATNAAFYGSFKLPVNANTQVGYVWTVTNVTTGAGEFQVSSGGGGGGGTGNVIGPSSSTIGNVAIFSSTDGKHVGDGGTLGTAALQPASAFDSAGAASGVQAFATSYSNSVNVASGNSAAVSTNRFITPAQLAILSNNINGANIFGQVPATSLGTGSSISTKFLRGDLTWQSIVGGGDMLAANNLSDVANTATALANLNGVPNTRALTINGTANQITSSAGSQNLTADRIWTVSIPNPFTVPGVENVIGTLNVTGDQTNQGNLSITGNTTNFGNVKVGGNQTNAGTLWVHGNQTNDGNIKVVGTVTANLFSGSGASLTSLNGGNITAGTLSSNAMDAGTLAQLFATSSGFPLTADGDMAGFSLTNGNNLSLTGTVSAAEIDTPLLIATNLSTLNLFTNVGSIITNNTGVVLQNSNGVFESSNAVNTTYFNLSSNRTARFGSNGVDTVTITPTSGNVTATSFTGSGAALTSLPGSAITGAIPLGALPSDTITNNYAGTLTANGFTGSGSGLTNTVSWTHEGTTTNINVVFNGTLQTYTLTNGPDVWLNWSGANGSSAFQVLSNINIHSSTTFNKFIAGSNGVSAGVYKVTNGWFTVTSMGGTNSVQLAPAIKENQ